jgi:hypothetical protein
LPNIGTRSDTHVPPAEAGTPYGNDSDENCGLTKFEDFRQDDRINRMGFAFIGNPVNPVILSTTSVGCVWFQINRYG